VDNAISFTITLDDMVDTHRLATRKYALAVGILFILLGLGIAAVVHPAALALAVVGGLTLLDWRFPIVDRWFIRRRAAARIGAICEVWLDETGIAYRQAGLSGHIDWSLVTRIIEDDRSLILVQGGLALMAIPKRAFDSPEAAARFVTVVRLAGRWHTLSDSRAIVPVRVSDPEYGPEFPEAIRAAFAPGLEALGFHLVDVLEDGVRFDGKRVGFEARYVPRDGELAVYLMPHDSGGRLSLPLYLSAIGSDVAAGLGAAVAESSDEALQIARAYATALPEAAKLLSGDPAELARARDLRWWNVGDGPSFLK
jgi:hypothetical protein